MCTVSFYKDQNKVVFTSNRDESLERPLALMPKGELLNDRTVYFPKDPKAGGTWFAVNDKGFVFVLLNGAEKKHESKPPYRESRGKIVLQLASSIDFETDWNFIDLEEIEPFTMIAYVYKELLEMRWNGISKNLKRLNNIDHKIWSSSTLYSPEISSQREYWFNDFLESNKYQLNANNLIDFHSNTHREDQENGVLINRLGGKMLTKNITQYTIENETFTLFHKDLILNSSTILKVDVT